jgi:endonuclease YncB( thermonuclease family)
MDGHNFILTRLQKMMRKYFPHLYLILSTFLLIGATTAVNQQWNSVKWISDGDTIVLNDGRHVRYIGINAPEIAHGQSQGRTVWICGKKIQSVTG